MHAPLAEQHRWYSSVLRGHYGYFGMPHNWRALNGFPRSPARLVQLPAAAKPESRRMVGLVRRSDRHASLSRVLDHSSLGGGYADDAGHPREEPGAGKPHARICEGEAEWPSYSTIPRRRSSYVTVRARPEKPLLPLLGSLLGLKPRCDAFARDS